MVEVSMASATKAQARLSVPPDENRNEIDNGQCNKEVLEFQLQVTYDTIM